MRIGLTFDDVLLVPKYSDILSRDMVDTSTTLHLARLNRDVKFDLPIANAAMATVSSVDMMKAISDLGGLPFTHRMSTPHDALNAIKLAGIENKTYALSLGVNSYKEWLDVIRPGKNVYLSVDVAHGHHKSVYEMMKWLLVNYPDNPIIAGSIATSDAAYELMAWGADLLRVGIGGGSVCTTRIKTGIGIPQLTAIIDVADRYSDSLISDGAIRYSGDGMKAFVAGAKMLMMGNVLAGTDECPGELVKDHRGVFKRYVGMASKSSAIAITGRSDADVYDEGISALVPYKGSVRVVILEFMKGIRSGLSYIGVDKLEDANQAEFIQITNAGWRESSSHDVVL